MNSAWALVGVLGGFVAGYLWMTFRAKPKFVSQTELWVYLPGTQMPDQTAMMVNLVGQNPYIQKGRNPIGPAEGLLFSDIRLSMTLVLRAKNPRMFDPMTALIDIPNTPDQVEVLLRANSVVRLRYISEQPLPDKRHLQFLYHAADALQRLGNGSLVLDLTARKLWSKDGLETALKENMDATVPSIQIRQDLKEDDSHFVLTTFGFKKIGVDDFETYPMPLDYRVLGMTVFDNVVESVWKGSPLEELSLVEAFGDEFKITVEPEPKSKRQLVRIHRVHGAL